MNIKLLDLWRYAIDNRIGIRFSDPYSGHECTIVVNAQARASRHDEDFRIEDVLAAARSFQLIGQGKSQSYTHDQMAGIISESLKRRGPAATSKDSE